MRTRHAASSVLFTIALVRGDSSPRRDGAARPPSSEPFVPDPATVERFGKAYRYPQAGWIVLHVEGEPYERGYQHGHLLATELAAIVKGAATQQNPRSPE